MFIFSDDLPVVKTTEGPSKTGTSTSFSIGGASVRLPVNLTRCHNLSIIVNKVAQTELFSWNFGMPGPHGNPDHPEIAYGSRKSCSLD